MRTGRAASFGVIGRPRTHKVPSRALARETSKLNTGRYPITDAYSFSEAHPVDAVIDHVLIMVSHGREARQAVEIHQKRHQIVPMGDRRAAPWAGLSRPNRVVVHVIPVVGDRGEDIDVSLTHLEVIGYEDLFADSISEGLNEIHVRSLPGRTAIPTPQLRRGVPTPSTAAAASCPRQAVARSCGRISWE